MSAGDRWCSLHGWCWCTCSFLTAPPTITSVPLVPCGHEDEITALRARIAELELDLECRRLAVCALTDRAESAEARVAALLRVARAAGAYRADCTAGAGCDCDVGITLDDALADPAVVAALGEETDR